jgi:hypothetical protein
MVSPTAYSLHGDTAWCHQEQGHHWATPLCDTPTPCASVTQLWLGRGCHACAMACVACSLCIVGSESPQRCMCVLPYRLAGTWRSSWAAVDGVRVTPVVDARLVTLHAALTIWVTPVFCDTLPSILSALQAGCCCREKHR